MVQILEILPVCLGLVAFVMVRTHPEWLNPDPVTAEDASLRFHMLMGYLGLGFAGCILTGRVLWRRWKAPGADRLSVLSWRRVGRVGLPVPGLSWTSMGQPVRTWAGGLIAAAMVLVLTFVAHHPTVGNLLNPVRPALGFDDASKVSGTWAVDPGSPLAEAGLLVGDLVVAAGGEPVSVHLDLVAAIRDAEGKTLALTVARPRPRGTDVTPPPPEMLTLQVRVRSDPAGCRADTPCGWAGRVSGLFSPLKTSMPVEAQVSMFLREVGTVARMIVDPELRGHSELRGGHERGFRVWLDWLAFRMAAGTGITLTFVALFGALALQHFHVCLASWRSRSRTTGDAPVAAG